MQVLTRIKNNGTTDERITVRVEIKELGIREIRTVTISEKSGKLLIFDLEIPNNSLSGNYIIEARAYNRFWHSIKHTSIEVI